MKKVMVAFGILFGLRGSSEQVNLEVKDIGHGWYAQDHESFAGLEWYGLKGKTDKKHKLDKNNCFVRDDDEMCRYPVLPKGCDPKYDAGGSIKRFVAKLVKDEGKNRLYRRISVDGKRFVNCPLGKDKVRNKFKQAFKFLGISNWDTLRPHALRGFFVIMMVNNPNVSLKECMGAARHVSVSANAAYQQRNSASESARVNALCGGIATALANGTAQNYSASKKEDKKMSPVGCSTPRTCASSSCDSGEEVDLSTAPTNEIVLASAASTASDPPPYTQMQLEYLENEIQEIQSGRMMTHRSPPRRFSSASGGSSRSYAQRHSPRYERVTRYSPYGNFRYHRDRPTRPRPSHRELEIRAMRRRIAQLRNQQLASYPYRNDQHEEECLYNDYIENSRDGGL